MAPHAPLHMNIVLSCCVLMLSACPGCALQETDASQSDCKVQELAVVAVTESSEPSSAALFLLPVFGAVALAAVGIAALRWHRNNRL